MKKNRKQAVEILYSEWENFNIPSNFTEDHSLYEDAIEFVMINGYFHIIEFYEWL